MNARVARRASVGPTPEALAAGNGPLASVMALTSGKGGVGKTVLAANLAAALAARGERVLVLDADLGLANLDVLLNLVPKVTLHDVFSGKATLERATLDAPGGFSVLLAGSGLVEYSRLTPELRGQLLEAIEALRPRFDRVLLDTGAGISEVVLYTISLADEVLVVATPEPTSLADAYATIKVLAMQQQRTRIRLVVNQSQQPGEGKIIRAHLQQVVDRYVSTGTDQPLKLDFLGEVPADAAMREAVQRRCLLLDAWPGAAASQAIGALAARLVEG